MKRFFSVFAIIFTILLLAVYLGISWFFSELILRSRNGNVEKRVEAVRAVDGPSAKRMVSWLSVPDTFVVEGVDHAKIRGWYFQADSSNCAVIMAHGYRSSRMAMDRYFYLFEDCGCDIITYDHRGHGLSENTYCTFGIKESEDLLAVTEWAKEKTGFSGEQIGWLGVSWGAATVLQAGGSDENVAFIISDSPFDHWYSAVMERGVRDYGSWITAFTPTIKFLLDTKSGVDFDRATSLAQVPNIDEPVFLIHSKTDEATGSEQSVRLSKALDPQNSVFHHTDWGNGHAKDISKNPKEYQTLVEAFMDKFVPNFGACQLERKTNSPDL